MFVHSSADEYELLVDNKKITKNKLSTQSVLEYEFKGEGNKRAEAEL